VSKHLAVLKRAGIVRDSKHGTFSEYSLTCGCVTHFIDCIEQGMSEEAANGAARESAKKSCSAKVAD
ncbi:MAG: hypothetical protein LLF89_04140, partial [Spirochaetaceae bacterium]|nr:hypothetical protein [Spirochaetaceae bacterium]